MRSVLCFFFSSRRRHTRFDCDWSSDVCSSDLQEVRYDELGGVSYTKGCYTGQETVSRLHFRGHTNRYLRGLLFDAEPPATPADGWSSVTHLDRDVGRVTSLAWVPESGVAGGGRWIGLALIRRDVGSGVMVRAAGRDARVVDLPFATPFVGPA